MTRSGLVTLSRDTDLAGGFWVGHDDQFDIQRPSIGTASSVTIVTTGSSTPGWPDQLAIVG
ncbi:hypothetical protein [Tessaracoccus sp. OH4464_COT-324]|uniref:hypothetical protein n=1 Tax=Tessaracoccus sp. OH4464_COT-324 TaxID=2491059 RepID=UPI000F63DA86|nr:hypothetical protein [Tessaracoccus sp. OH4464_COT-324]RRD41970.1 hypothetical protein EII42_12245 [Tessaracoccus sp. OH4464_COT-324]